MPTLNWMDRNTTPRASDLRQQRLDELLDSMEQSVLQQITGPFGLTPAMFDDRDGGNVTTQHNADQGIFAKKEEEYDPADYKYDKAKKEKREEKHAKGELDKKEFKDDYTGKQESSTRTRNTDGKIVVNYELDHTVPREEIHRKGGWMMDKEDKEKLASNKDNLHFTTKDNNRQKSNKPPETALSGEQYDPATVDPLIDKARKSIAKDLPDTLYRAKYHAKDIARTGTQDAVRNGIRQALGVMCYELAHGCITELKRILRERNPDNLSLASRILDAVKRVLHRVLAKLKSALGAGLSGALQGFAHTVLTFLINNFITTAKKIVTILREGMKGLWQAIKLMVNPPEGMSAMEIARNVSKIFVGVAVTAIGMALESSLNAALAGIPVLGQFAGLLSPVFMGILTGLVGAVLVYSVDRLFDWLSSTGTEKLQALENRLHVYGETTEQMFRSLALQFDIQEDYALMGQSYQRSSTTLAYTRSLQQKTLQLQAESIQQAKMFNQNLHESLQKISSNRQFIADFLAQHQKSKGKNLE